MQLSLSGQQKLAGLQLSEEGLWRNARRREELIRQALHALHLLHKDQDYLVFEDKVLIIDANTGRTMPDRSWERGLHQMIETKEGCAISGRQETLARISYQRFFRRYLHLSGGGPTLARVEDGTEIELAMQYTDGYNEDTFTFVNNINTHEGGTHLSGFKAALTRTINSYASRSNTTKKGDPSLSGDDVREGLVAVLSVKVLEPQFEGQTKTKLGNSEVRGIVESLVNDKLGTWLDENPSSARRIIEKAVQASRARAGAS